jgi:transcriptional regulator with XRE-family HTH domain
MWRPIRGALARLRAEKGLTAAALARRAGVSLRQITSICSKAPPKTIRVETLSSLAEALGCELSSLATWIDDATGERVGVADLDEWCSDTAPDPLPAVAAPAAATQPIDVSADDDLADELPPMGGTLSTRARRERELGLHQETHLLPSGAVDLLGFDRFKRCFA